MNEIVRLSELNRDASLAYFRAAMRRLAGATGPLSKAASSGTRTFIAIPPG